MSNSAELTSERLRFSTESQISAAGLLVLPKAKIREETFGKEGLVFSYQQLDRQRGVAQPSREVFRSSRRLDLPFTGVKPLQHRQRRPLKLIEPHIG